MDPDGFVAHREVYLKGRFPAAPNQIGVGSHLADELKVGLGGTVKVMNKPFTVSGVYQSGTFFEDAGASLQLKAARRWPSARARPRGRARAQARSRTATVRRAILRANPNLQAIASPDDAARAGGNSQLIGKAVVVIVELALIIGGIAVANTMAMAVLERQREFALMARSAGARHAWRRSCSARAGGEPDRRGARPLLGVVGAGLLVDALDASSYASPEVTAWGLGRGLLVGVAIGVLGGLYPAWGSAAWTWARHWRGPSRSDQPAVGQVELAARALGHGRVVRDYEHGGAAALAHCLHESSTRAPARCRARRWARRPAVARGSLASDRATATRWRSPPESSDGRAPARCPRPTSPSSSRAWSARSARLRPVPIMASSTLSAAVRWGRR